MGNRLEYENPRHRPPPESKCWFGLFSYLSFTATAALVLATCGGVRPIGFEIKPLFVAAMPFAGIAFGIAGMSYDPQKNFARSGLILNVMLIVAIGMFLVGVRLLVSGIH
jgi:hypothetical protein